MVNKTFKEHLNISNYGVTYGYISKYLMIINPFMSDQWDQYKIIFREKMENEKTRKAREKERNKKAKQRASQSPEKSKK